MNPYQRVGVLIMRLAGAIIAVVGFVVSIHVAISEGFGHHVPGYSVDRCIGSGIWAVGGVALILAGKPIGRFLGGGLE